MCWFGCVARCAVLLKPNVANILLFSFCAEKFVQYGPITIAIYCNGLSLLICQEKWPNYASGPKSALNSDSFFLRRLFKVCVRVFMRQFCLFTYPPRSMINELHLKRWFFFAKIGIFCKSIAGPLHSIIQAYTQPYSFGGRMKLIICQIKHELSEISTSWKQKTLDGGPNI